MNIPELPTQYDKLTPKVKKAVRKEYVKRQDGKCIFCGELLDKQPPQFVLDKSLNMHLFPPGFLKHPVHLQHDHSTGLTEGAVHAYCNGVLWQYFGV